MAFVVAEDKVEDFLKEKADKGKIKQIYKMTERFEKHHKPKQQTQADKIRSMSNEELAEFLNSMNACPIEGDLCLHQFDDVQCNQCILDWLKSEVKE